MTLGQEYPVSSTRPALARGTCSAGPLSNYDHRPSLNFFGRYLKGSRMNHSSPRLRRVSHGSLSTSGTFSNLVRSSILSHCVYNLVSADRRLREFGCSVFERWSIQSGVGSRDCSDLAMQGSVAKACSCHFSKSKVPISTLVEIERCPLRNIPVPGWGKKALAIIIALLVCRE